MNLEWLSLLLGGATLLFLGAVLAFQFLSRYGEAGAARKYEALRQPAKTSNKQALHNGMHSIPSALVYRSCVPTYTSFVVVWLFST
jgi:hypothetical protein